MRASPRHISELDLAGRRGFEPVQLPRQVGQSGGARAFIIKAVQGDYLECHTLDRVDGVPKEGTDTINVARPYTLRRTPFDGFIVNGITYDYSTDQQRTATMGTTVEEQFVTPDYLVGQTIMAALMRGDTAAVDEGVPQVYIPWEDLNVDGRAWAWDPEA